MSHPVRVEQVNGHFSAIFLADPTVRADASTRELAIARVQDEIERRYVSGELVDVELPSKRSEVNCSIGILKDDPSMDELRELMRHRRDLEPYPDYE